MIRGLNDSKQVLPALRIEIAEQVKESCAAWSVGVASVEEIDRLNIYWASVLAMERALASLSLAPQYLITDAVRIKSFRGPQEPLVKGDARSATVAAASIVAKVHRDNMLVDLHAMDPRYGFADHKGYATPEHLRALKEFGPSPHHRSGWWRVREAQLQFGFDAVTAE
jgi:ribonuclease HII